MKHAITLLAIFTFSLSAEAHNRECNEKDPLGIGLKHEQIAEVVNRAQYASLKPDIRIETASAFQRGPASFYGKGDIFHGRQTANGEIFNRNAMTAAHRTLPFGTCVKVTNLRTKKSTKVRINDRGPYAKGRIIDLSYAAAGQIDMVKSGHAPVALSKCNN